MHNERQPQDRQHNDHQSSQTHDAVTVSEHTLLLRAPRFHIAWQELVFSLVVTLVRDGRMPWVVFQERLARHINKPRAVCLSAEEINRHYFDCWLDAAHETLVAEGFITDEDIANQVERIHDCVERTRSEQLANKPGDGPIAVFPPTSSA